MDKKELETFQYRLGSRLQVYRLKKNYTQEQLAAYCGVTKTYISNIENGKTKQPASIVKDYCECLKVPVEEMLNLYIVPGNESSAKIEMLSKMMQELPDEDIDCIIELVKLLLSKK